MRRTPAPGPASSLGELLARARFEVVPLRGVEEEVAHLRPGTTVTVTCSPRRGVDGTLDLAERLSERGYEVVPHISARLVAGRGHLEEILGRLAHACVRDLFVIGGDVSHPAGPYVSAGALLGAIAELDHGPREIGIAGYPEGHPLIDDEALFQALREKQRLATYLVTQICFDPHTVFDWVARMRDRGIHLPVHIGLPGAGRRRKLLEISLRVGVGDSVRYLAKHGSLMARLMRRGGYRPEAFVLRAAARIGDPELGIGGFHVFTFNQVGTTEGWRRQLLAALRAAGHPIPGRGEDEFGTAS